MSAPIAIWDWKHEPVPAARVVVCRPVLVSCLFGDGPHPCMPRGNYILAASSGELQRFTAPNRGPSDCTLALYAERQADLTGVGALLTVQAERRALVLCPREALNLHHTLCCYTHSEGVPPSGWGPTCHKVEPSPLIDVVVIIPPPEARRCDACGGDGFAMEPYEGPVHHRLCNGSGRIEPWPLHPVWVSGIVKQCRAAGVPVAFLGWGPWCPISDIWPPPPKGTEERYVWRFRENDPNDLPITCFRVGTERAGRTLGDVEVMELPEWLT